MKFTKYTFLILGLASSLPFDAYAAYCNSQGSKAPAGKYCKALSSFDCEKGCYCEGGGNFTWAVGDVEKGCKNRWSKVTSELNSKGVYLCPEGFTESDKGAKTKNQCYRISGNKKDYYPGTSTSTSSATQINVDAGKFLPKNSETPITCTNTTNTSSGIFASNWYCPGGKFTKSSTKDQGISGCPTGTIPDENKKKCVEPTFLDCQAGYYMPENGTACARCNFFMYCPGGRYKTKHTSDGADWYCAIVEVERNNVLEYTGVLAPFLVEAGITENELSIPTLNGGPCEKMKDVTVTCQKGTYLHKMSRFCDQCESDTVCEGGTFHLSLYDNQGLGEKCTAPAHPNNNTGKCERDTVNCEEGTYLPTNASACTNCRTNFVCTGGRFEINPAYDKGIGEECIPPARPDHHAGKCVHDTVNCIKGTYLPANSTLTTGCRSCPSNKVCPGGDFEVGWDIDQGALDKTNVTVEPGYYLPKGSNETKKCTSTSKFCPGGKYEPSTSRDQGIVDCPKNSRANDAKTACTITLTKKQLMYGVSGSGGKYSENALQCWTKTGDEYRKCMGFNGGSYTPTNSGSGITYKPIGNLHMNLSLPAVNAVQAAAVQASANFIDK